MHYAAKTGNVAILKRLLAAGADKNAVDRIKQTPIDVAASEGNPPAFRLLLAQMLLLKLPALNLSRFDLAPE